MPSVSSRFRRAAAVLRSEIRNAVSTYEMKKSLMRPKPPIGSSIRGASGLDHAKTRLSVAWRSGLLNRRSPPGSRENEFVRVLLEQRGGYRHKAAEPIDVC